jgi:aminoglycoside phosphotransferase (APT) family kinase protein
MGVSAVVDVETQVVADWLSENVGGRVTSIQRQPRWRPQWIADVERGDEVIPLMIRGERYDTDMTWPLKHEGLFQQAMADVGVLVPKVWGWIDKPFAFVMDRVPGQSTFDNTSDADRDRVVDEYLQQLAILHTANLQPFIDAGIDRAASPDESAMIGIERMNVMYRRQKDHFDPQLDFFLHWISRHPPRSRGREGAVVWDSGQFMHQNGHITALIDVELGHIGDPMMDLAGWRMRDSILPFGRFSKLYDRYAELTGEAVDLEAIQIHHIYFTLSNQLAFSHALAHPPANSDFGTNMQWCNETNLYATEALAEYMDVELPTVDLPAPSVTAAAPAFGHLVKTLSTLRVEDEYTRYKLRGAFRMARHLHRWDEIGRQLEQDTLDDLHQLLGKRPTDVMQGNQLLEEFVNTQNEGGRHDVTLLTLFHRRNLRAQAMNGPAGSAMARHIPIQSFRD